MRTGDRPRLQRMPWAKAMPAKAQRLVDRHLEWVDVDDRSPITREGATADWVVFVESGDLLDSNASGSRWLGAGAIVGAVEALHTATYTSTVRAARPGTVALLDRRRFVGLLATVPDFALAIFRAVTAPGRSPERRAARHLRLVQSEVAR